MIVWTIPAHGEEVKTKLMAADGAVPPGLRRFRIDPAESAELQLDLPRGGHDVVHVMEAAPASYRLEVRMPDDVAGVTVVVAEPDSALTMETWAAPLSRQPGQPITLHARLRDGTSGIAGATVTARLASPHGKSFDAITLTDRGDGVYTATVADLPDNAPGAWQARFEAEGMSAKGVRFARTGAGELVAERGAARLDGRSVRAIVHGDALRITAAANVNLPGAYRFDVTVAGPSIDGSRSALAWGEAARNLDRGAATLQLDIPLALIGETPIDDLFLDVRLLALDTITVAGHVTAEVGR